MEEFFTPTLSHQMRLYPRQNHHTPTDAILILDLEDGSTSRFPVHKLILAAQSEFFEGLFTFEEQKIEFHIKSPPDLKNYLTEENFKIVLDTFYEIDVAPDLNKEKTLEIIVLANYFLADFLMEKMMKNLVGILKSFQKDHLQKRLMTPSDLQLIKNLIIQMEIELNDFRNPSNKRKLYELQELCHLTNNVIWPSNFIHRK